MFPLFRDMSCWHVLKSFNLFISMAYLKYRKSRWLILDGFILMAYLIELDDFNY